jgi:hypothetical protein
MDKEALADVAEFMSKRCWNRVILIQYMILTFPYTNMYSVELEVERKYIWI